jgi:uncharacterized protein
MTDELAPQQPGIPLPQPSSVSAPYWDAARLGRLVYQRCTRCGTVPRLPAGLCAHCGSHALEWTTSSGRGRLYSWTVVWRPQHPSFHVPYVPAVVAMKEESMAEEWWLMTAVVGCRLDDLRVDMPLQIAFHDAGGDIRLPYAEPAT